MMKKIIRRLHLILAMLSLIFLLNISISGALLVFAKEIQQTAQPQYWQVSPPGSSELPSLKKTLPLSSLLALVNESRQQSTSVIHVSPDHALPWQFQFSDGSYASVDQYRGTVLHRYQLEESFYGFVMAWHRWLLLTTEEGNRPFKVIVSMASLALIIEMLLGFWLWVNPKRPLKRLKVNFSAKPRVLFYQLHTVVGVFTMLPLLLIAFTGMTFHWQAPTQSFVETLTFGEVSAAEHPKLTPMPSDNWQLDLALNNGLEALTGAQLYRIYLPQNDQPLKLRVKMPDEFFANSWVWLNPVSGAVIDTFDATSTNTTTQVWNFRYSFHIGDFWGVGPRMLWLLLALLPGAFAVSGLWIYFKRAKTKKQRYVIF